MLNKVETVKPPNKTEAKKILKIVENYLYADSNNQVMKSQRCYEQLEQIAAKYNMSIEIVIAQGKDFLKRHSVSFNMNRI
jgi:hypothetical protein